MFAFLVELEPLVAIQTFLPHDQMPFEGLLGLEVFQKLGDTIHAILTVSPLPDHIYLRKVAGALRGAHNSL